MAASLALLGCATGGAPIDSNRDAAGVVSCDGDVMCSVQPDAGRDATTTDDAAAEDAPIPEVDACVAALEGETCNGMDDTCDGVVDENLPATVRVEVAPPTGSCSGESNRQVVFETCGCAPVTMNLVFEDRTDLSEGQMYSIRHEGDCLFIEWDDCPAGCDCDMDIAVTLCWTATVNGRDLSLRVTQVVTGTTAGHIIAAGFEVGGVRSLVEDGGSDDRTIDIACAAP